MKQPLVVRVLFALISRDQKKPSSGSGRWTPAGECRKNPAQRGGATPCGFGRGDFCKVKTDWTIMKRIFSIKKSRFWIGNRPPSSIQCNHPGTWSMLPDVKLKKSLHLCCQGDWKIFERKITSWIPVVAMCSYLVWLFSAVGNMIVRLHHRSDQRWFAMICLEFGTQRLFFLFGLCHPGLNALKCYRWVKL